MSTAEIENRALRRLFDRGDLATYTPTAGDPAEFRVLVKDGTDKDPAFYEGPAYAPDPEIEALAENITQAPERGASFFMLQGRHGGATFTVRDILAFDGLQYRLRVEGDV